MKPVVQPIASLRDRAKAAQAFTTETVEVPEWGDANGVPVFEVRSMTVAGKSAALAAARTGDGDDVDLGVLLPAVVVATAHDPATGKPAFEDADREWLAGANAKAVERLFLAGSRVSGLDLDDKVAEGKGDS